MRKALRLVLALSGASIMGAAFVIACSDDTSVTPGTEAGTDAQVDSPQVDSATDAGLDTSPPFDGGFVLDTFDTVLATEECKTLARCCYGTATPAEGGINIDGGVEGGTFDVAACIAKFKDVGFQQSNRGVALKDAGNVVLDQVSADDCIKKIQALSCDLPGVEYTAARAACYGVYSGKFAVGHACNGPIECQRGLFCKGQIDGGAGVCDTISDAGGPCGVANPDSQTEYEDQCSYRGGGGTGNFCQYLDDAGNQIMDAAAWACEPAGGAGFGCQISSWCKDTICDDATFFCKTPDRLFDPQCGDFVKP